jgi:type II secretory pathway component PulF
MGDTLIQFSEPGIFSSVLGFLLGFVGYMLLGLLPTLGVLYSIYFLLTIPMRRNERGRLFLDLLELGLKDGRTPEVAIVDAGNSHDPSLGARFHLLCAYLEQGDRLETALDKVPRLLPPQVRAVLKVGQRIGDVGKVLPACRMLLRDSVSHVRSAINYLVLLAFVVTPFTTVIPLVLKLKVLPAFKAVFADMFEGAALPAFTRFVIGADPIYLGIQVSLLFLVWIATLAYLGGPRLRRWLEIFLPGDLGWLDWCLCQLPWRRKRWQRDFSAMLAALLEEGVPETEAVRLAGESTANAVFRRRAEQACRLLQQGVRLPEAIRAVDGTRELQWRIGNALHSRMGFVRALAGWHEALEARAFQLEQATAQVVTTLLLLLNGLLVGSVVIGLFLALVALLNRATLW